MALHAVEGTLRGAVLGGGNFARALGDLAVPHLWSGMDTSSTVEKDKRDHMKIRYRMLSIQTRNKRKYENRLKASKDASEQAETVEVSHAS